MFRTNPAPSERRNWCWRGLALASVATVGLATGAVVAAAPASATPGTLTWALGQFLTGTAGATDLATVPELAGSGASYPTLPSPAALPIDASALNGLPTTLAGSIPLFGSGGVLTLEPGTVNQVASAAASGDLLAASGAVTDAGVPDLGSLGVPTTIDATDLLSQVPAVGAALSGLQVSLDGIAAKVTQAAGNPPAGSSDVLGGVMTITSPVLAGIPAAVLDALAPVQDAVNGLAGQSGGFAGALGTLSAVQAVLTSLGLPATNDITIDGGDLSFLTAAVTPVMGQTLQSPDGFVGLTPSTGTITADLAGLLGGDLGSSGLPVNADVLSSTVLTTISTDVTNLVSTLVAAIEDAVSSAIGSAPVSLSSTAGTVSGLLATGLDIDVVGTIQQILDGNASATSVLMLAGVPLTLTDADLLDALGVPISTDVLTGALPDFDTSLVDQLTTPATDTLAPALDQLDSVVAMTGNAQSTLGGVFTETALLTTLLPGNPLGGLLNLGTASVGSVPAVAPTASALSPTRGPVAGGQQVTVTGTNFVPGLTSVQIGGKTVAGSDVNVAASRTSLTFRTPAHAAATTTLTVQTPAGTSSALSYRYLPAPTAAAVHPNSGPTAGGRPLAVTGSGFVAGATTVGIGGSTVAAGKVHVVSSTRLSITTPAHTAGTTNVSVTTPGGSSSGRSYVYRRAPKLTGLSAARGSRAGGRVITATGSSFVPGRTGIRIGGKTLRATEVHVLSASKLRFTTPAHAKGTVSVSAFTVGGASAGKQFRYVRGAAHSPQVLRLNASGGPTTGGQHLVVGGSGFVPGATSLRIGATTIGAATVTVVSPTRLWVRTPAHAAGKVAVRAVTSGRTSNVIGYVYARPSATPFAAPHISSPKSGTSTRNNAPFVSGTGAVGAAVSVFADGMPYCTAHVTSARTWTCAGVAPLLAGRHIVRARQTAAGHSASPLTGAVVVTVR